MRRFSKGNIVKIGDEIVIIEKYRTIENSSGTKKVEVVDWISFNHPNASGSTKVHPETTKEMCWDCSTNDGCKDEDCETCKGTGFYEEYNPGMSGAVYLASCAKEYIIKCMLKNFDF